jgi:TetR/AcrR family transcriptional regulator, cholesterol catabolism regulator
MSQTEPAASSRSEQGKAARRSRVIEVAMFMAHEGGYDAVHMRAVAEKADVSLGTIYRYFKGKDDLLLAGLVGWVRLLRRRIESESLPGGTVADRLSSVLAEAAGAADGAPVLMGALITALSTTDPAAADYKLAVESEVQQLMVVAMGDEPNVDAIGVARVVGHVWLSAISRWVGGLAPAGSVEEELRHAVNMLVGTRVTTDR